MGTMIFEHSSKPLFMLHDLKEGYRVWYKDAPIEITFFEIRRDKALVVGNDEHCFDFEDLREYKPKKMQYSKVRELSMFFINISNGLSGDQMSYIDSIYSDELKEEGLPSLF